MMNKKINFFKHTFFLLSFVFFAGCQQQPEENGGATFEDFDLDASSDIDREEFYKNTYESGYWKIYDRNDDGVITIEEWHMGLDEYYEDWDREKVAETYGIDIERKEGITVREMADGTFVIWDTNGDGRIDSTEFREGVF